MVYYNHYNYYYLFIIKIVISDDKVFNLVDIRIGRKFREFVGHEKCLRCQCWSIINPNIICTAGEDCTIRVWDIRKPTTVNQLYIFNQHLYSPLEKSFYKNDEDGYNQRKLKTNNKSHNSSINKIHLSSDGHFLYSINNTGSEIHKWDLYNGNRIDIIYPKVIIDSVIEDNYGIPLDIINNNDNDDYLVIGSHSIIRVINLNNPNDEILLKGHMGSVNCVKVRQSHCEMYKYINEYYFFNVYLIDILLHLII